MSFEFKSYPKIPRLEKLVWSITEKLDGTNGIVHIVLCDGGYVGAAVAALEAGAVAVVGGFAVFAGSRARWLQPGKTTDNYGFAQYVKDNADELVATLGEGTHYGEWWGQGIQRKYGQESKHFTLFAPWRYPQVRDVRDRTGDEIITKVPLLATGGEPLSLHNAIALFTAALKRDGSLAVPGFTNPEGLVVTIGNQNHKIIVNDGDKAQSRDGA